MQDMARGGFQGLTVERRVEFEPLIRRLLICLTPSVKESIRLRKPQTFIGKLGPLAIHQFSSHIADVAETDIRCLRELGDPPCASGVAQEHSQHLRGFRLEDGF
ncbi:hypothetical protein HY68_38215 [Streptomyces sp. AcH 505]|nr:hypothetical protein HY68_38215 [Streptomyces sp. AcH 505]